MDDIAEPSLLSQAVTLKVFTSLSWLSLTTKVGWGEEPREREREMEIERGESERERVKRECKKVR